jgi:hypothetical protein
MLRSAVEAETPDVRAKIMASLGERGEETGRCAKPEHRRRVWKYAAALALAALTVTGALTLPKNSVISGPAASAEGTASGSGNTKASVMKNPFVIEAYAAEKDAGAKLLSKTAGISLLRPVSITGIDCSKITGDRVGESLYDDVNLLRKENGTQLYAKYVGFNLKCVGKNIKSVTYTTDRGGFAQIVNLNSEKYQGINLVSPYEAEQERKNFEKNKDAILKKDPNYRPSEPNPNYGDGKSAEEGANWGNDKEHIESYGYLPVGASYTLAYADQDDYTKQYACRLPITYTDAEVAAMDQISMKELFHRASKAMDGTVVTVTANYGDGTKASKQCVLKLDPETWVFHAVEK